MKQPETKLPYSHENHSNSKETSFILDSEDNFVARSVRNKDAEYITEACNNYPEAIKFLKQVYETMITLSNDLNYSSRRWYTEHVEPTQKFLYEFDKRNKETKN
jgi:hypothetical protein